MAFYEYETVAITTATDGSATVYTDNVYNGNVKVIQYTKGTLATTADLTITADNTGLPILTKANATASENFFPVQPADVVADGTASSLTEVSPVLVDERIKIVVAQGGNTAAGSITVIVGG